MAWPSDVVRAVASYASRGKDVAARLQAIVNAVERLGVVLEMAVLAGLAEAGAKLRQVFVVAFGVRHLIEPSMTIGAAEILVHRTFKKLVLHEEWSLFTALERHAEAVIAVARKAFLVLVDCSAPRGGCQQEELRKHQKAEGERWLS
jgi:hypothetical protein